MFHIISKCIFNKLEMANAPEGLNQVILRKVRFDVLLFAKDVFFLPKTLPKSFAKVPVNFPN